VNGGGEVARSSGQLFVLGFQFGKVTFPTHLRIKLVKPANDRVLSPVVASKVVVDRKSKTQSSAAIRRGSASPWL